MAIYEGEILKDVEISDNLRKVISKKNELVVLMHGEEPYKVVIGVPHHANIKDSHICEDSPDGKRPSDENAASYAIVAYNALKENEIPAKLVIMAHAAGKDPNKDKESLYFKEIFDDSAEILFECHGAAGNRPNDLEISAGRNELADTKKFGRLLAEHLKNRFKVAMQKKAGTSEALIISEDGTEKEGKLKWPGNETESLIAAGKEGIQALHLEAKPQFRIPEEGKSITNDGRQLGMAIAQAIMEYK